MKEFDLSNFLKIKNQFKLGALTTEGFHKDSKNLSYMKSIAEAVDIFKTIDVEALTILQSKKESILSLHKEIQRTLNEGKKIFLCGCGATGRLSLSLEFLFRKKYNTDQVISFMAGGDYALIKSVESFEDRLDYGQRQLQDLGFSEGDMLISITEGGETSFVIGASLFAVEVEGSSNYFLYCNPDEELMGIDRSKKVLLDKRIQKINLTTGPMTISGSTRMQATTVQMLAVGLALLNHETNDISDLIDEEIQELIDLDYSELESFIKAEYESYVNDEIVTYSVDEEYAICVLTDTTERSPTFSLKGFETLGDDVPALAYLSVKKATDAKQAWKKILAREPRCLIWNDMDRELGDSELYKFDISEKTIARRSALKDNVIFDISLKGGHICMCFKSHNMKIAKSKSLLIDHLKLKVLLNTHSSMVMCRLGRVEGNMMSYVRPSNYKLIDRASRYIVEISKGEISYEMALERVVSNLEQVSENESIVLKCLKA